MNRKVASAGTLIAAALVAAPHASPAQTFKTEKFNIGGEGAYDYLTAEPGTGRVFVTRSNHVMVIDGPSGKVLGDIPNTLSVHGVALVPKYNRGYTSNSRDSTVTVFDLKTLAVLQTIQTHTGGLDPIMYDEASDRVFTWNHSRNPGSGTAINPTTGEIIGSIILDGVPETAVSDGKGRIYVNIEDKNEIQVVDAKTLKSIAIWSIAPCESPTGLAIDRATMRLFSGCSKISVAVDAVSGKVVAQFPVGNGVDAAGFDPSEKLIYIPASEGNVTVIHEDSPDKYTVVATVPTVRGARTIAVDPGKHMAYVFTPEYGPAAPAAAGTTPPAGGRGPRGPMIGAWLVAISH